jgi:hypothetical protein
MDIQTWVQQNDIFAKLRAAVELLRNSGGDVALEGLQNGKCTVDLFYNGEFITIIAHPADVPKPDSPAPEIKPIFEETQEPAVVEEEVKSDQPEPEQKKRRRYTS